MTMVNPGFKGLKVGIAFEVQCRQRWHLRPAPRTVFPGASPQEPPFFSNFTFTS